MIDSIAAQYGHLECLQYLRENDCPWNSDTCSSAASGGYLNIFEWALENGRPCKIDIHSTSPNLLRIIIRVLSERLYND